MTENEQDQFVNTLMITNDQDQTSTAATPITNISRIKFIPFILSFFFFLIGIINMTVFYFIPMSKINENKKKFPNATFPEISGVIVVLHFIFYTCFLFFAICLLLFSLRGFFIRHFNIIIILLIASCSLVFIFYVTYFTLTLTLTEETQPRSTLDEIKEVVNDDSPVDFSFIYSSEVMKTHQCHQNPNTGQMSCSSKYLTCYSENGVVFPLKSKNQDDHIFPSDLPPIFYFKIKQTVNMSEDYKVKFNQLIEKIEECSYEEKVIEYFPFHNQSWLVSNTVIPGYLTHKARILSASFGVGVFYELYSRSLPIVSYEQKVYLDTVPRYNYDLLWTSESCGYYGECDPYNKKPEPKI